MVGHGGSGVGSYLADPTSPIPSHCRSIVLTSTLRVKFTFWKQIAKKPPTKTRPHWALLTHIYWDNGYKMETRDNVWSWCSKYSQWHGDFYWFWRLLPGISMFISWWKSDNVDLGWHLQWSVILSSISEIAGRYLFFIKVCIIIGQEYIILCTPQVRSEWGSNLWV